MHTLTVSAPSHLPFLTPTPVPPNKRDESGPSLRDGVGGGVGKRRGNSSAGWCPREGPDPNPCPTSLFPLPVLHSRAALGPAEPVAGLEVHELSRRGAATIMTGNSLHFDHQQLGFLHPEAAARLLILELPGAIGPLGEELAIQHPAPPHPGPPPSHPPRKPPPSPGSRRPLQSGRPSDWGLYIPRHTCVPVCVCVRAHVTRRGRLRAATSPTCTTAPWGPGLGAPSHCSCPASLMGPARVGRGFLILAKMTVPPPPPPSLQPSRRFNPSVSCFSGCLTSSILSLTSCLRLLFLHQGGDGNRTQGPRLPLSAGFQGVGVQEGLAHGWGVYF